MAKVTKSTNPPVSRRVVREPAAVSNTSVICKIKEIQVDPAQYKPYTPILAPEDTFVRVDFNDPRMTRDGNEIILSLEGFTAFLSTIATAIDTMHHDRQLKIQDIYNKR